MIRLFFLKRRTPPSVLQLFTRQLALLLEAGLPLLRALEILARQEPHPFFRKTLLEVIKNIQSGSTLSESLELHPRLFSSLYLTMIRAGEMSAMLGTVLSRLVSFQEKMQKIKNKMSSILVYPTLVFMMTLLTVIFLVTFIIPKFELVFSEALEGGTLPPLTHCVLEVSRYGGSHCELIALLIGILFIAFRIAWILESPRRFLDRAFLYFPLLGELFKKHFIAQCFNTLGTLMLHRVPPLEALQITQTISDNRAIQGAMKMIHQSLQAGDSMIYPLQASNLFPPMVMSMVAVGEETGQLPEMLLQVATLYEQEVDHRTTQLMALIEPLLLLLLACLVGTVVIALFLPLMTMIGSMGG
ncbi:MAG: type II secretion system F family protein [Verrucomicrobia bacterium]|jgi:type IV pilus assembly protein PilC|nr:MAG: type II secretion system F family protein [Verrucomicrobiota bacterium]MDH4470651.1 type II secretion system F family protein [Verrucomicrobiae bacterium]